MTSYRIWDPVVRIFHWSLAGLFLANALVTDDESAAHEWVGYAIGALIALRLVWGLVGPDHARLAGFRPRPGAVSGQLSDIATGRRRIHLGHTPLGALMILNLLATLVGLILTGHMMTTDAFWGIEWVEEAHEGLVVWAGISVVVHVAGVLFESRRTGVNLPRAMVTGRKDLPDDARLVP